MPPRKQTPLVTREGPAADTQAPASPATVELTTGLGKRPRDDELHQLELERARIELERQRISIADNSLSTMLGYQTPTDDKTM
jgi:hypothetical protein